MFSIIFQKMSRRRRERAIRVGLIVTVVLYLMVVFVAEPLMALG